MARHFPRVLRFSTLLNIFSRLLKNSLEATKYYVYIYWLQLQYIYQPSQVKLYYDRRSVGQSVLVSGTHLEPATNFFILPLIILDSYGFTYVGRRVCSFHLFFLCWTSPAQPFTGVSPTGLKSTFYCFYFWDSLNLEGQIPVFISPRNRIAQLYSLAFGLSA
jgi:hypothetical protein